MNFLIYLVRKSRLQLSGIYFFATFFNILEQSLKKGLIYMCEIDRVTTFCMTFIQEDNYNFF